MNSLVIEGTTQTPKVEFLQNGNLHIGGISTLSHAQKFYVVLVDWLKEFKKEKPSSVKLVLAMYYINTSSALMFVDILRVINSFKSEGCALTVVWCYEEDDEDILSFGEQLEVASNSQFDFELVS